jgi:DNA replication protein DnaC
MTMSIIEIKKTLKELRLPGALATLDTRLLEAQSSNLSALEVLADLLQDEVDRRHTRLLDKCFQRSGLPERTSLAEFDWSYNPHIPKRTCFELNTLKFIAEGNNGIFVGKTGTGKSHIAKAIAYSAVRTGLHVMYVEADELLSHLAMTVVEPARKKKLLKPLIDADLLVLDDLFLRRKIAPESADELQAILHRRYSLRRSCIITTNRVIDDWSKCLGDAALTTAILDRLMHRCIPVEFRGRSYRLKEASSRLVNAEQSE